MSSIMQEFRGKLVKTSISNDDPGPEFYGPLNPDMHSFLSLLMPSASSDSRLITINWLFSLINDSVSHRAEAVPTGVHRIVDD